MSVFIFFFVKQKTAYEMRISDWSSDVCSSDLFGELLQLVADLVAAERGQAVQAQIEDRAALAFGELIGVAGNLGLDRFDAPAILRAPCDRPFAGEQCNTPGGRARRPPSDADPPLALGSPSCSTHDRKCVF